MTEETQNYIKTHKEFLEIRELADSTIKIYTSCITQFLEWLYDNCNTTVEAMTWNDIRLYVTYLKDCKGLNPRTINVHLAQLRDFYEYVLKKAWDKKEVPFKHFDEKLPKVPTREQTAMIIEHPSNLKHKALLVVLYSAGLRVSEACRLKFGDIYKNNGHYIYIIRSKNRSDRRAVLSDKALKVIKEYALEAYPDTSLLSKDDYIFPGQKPGTCISTETARQVMKAQLKDLGLEDSGFTPKSLRHAFGLHLLDDGVNLAIIKEAMGHKSLRSTEVYLELGIGNGRNVISPYDR